jgi:hypothetical protein
MAPNRASAAICGRILAVGIGIIMPLDVKRKRREFANDGIDNKRGASILWLHFPKADAMSGVQ